MHTTYQMESLEQVIAPGFWYNVGYTIGAAADAIVDIVNVWR